MGWDLEGGERGKPASHPCWLPSVSNNTDILSGRNQKGKDERKAQCKKRRMAGSSALREQAEVLAGSPPAARGLGSELVPQLPALRPQGLGRPQPAPAVTRGSKQRGRICKHAMCVCVNHN